MLYSVFVLLISALVFQMLYVLIHVLIACEKKHVSLLNDDLIADCFSKCFSQYFQKFLQLGTILVLLFFAYKLSYITYSIVSHTSTFSFSLVRAFWNFILVKQAFISYNFSCTQNRFRCTSVHVGDRARKRADVHVTNNNMVRQ